MALSLHKKIDSLILQLSEKMHKKASLQTFRSTGLSKTSYIFPSNKQQSPKFAHSMYWTSQKRKNPLEKPNDVKNPEKKSRSTFINIKNVRYKLAENEIKKHPYNISNIEFPSFSSTKRFKQSKTNLMLKNNEGSTYSDNFSPKQQNIKSGLEQYLNINNFKALVNENEGERRPKKGARRWVQKKVKETQGNIQGWNIEEDYSHVLK